MKRMLVLFGIGAAGYSLIELAARGWTHWTMSLAGGACLVLLDRANSRMKRGNLLARAGVGAAIITAVELGAGLVVNRLLGWNVWDYSGQRWNILGQVCPRFTIYWFLLCLPVLAGLNKFGKRPRRA